MSVNRIKKNIKLTPEEIAIEKEIEDGEWVEASEKFKQETITFIKKTVAKKKREARINIRMTTETLEMIQQLASQEGIGYQTLIGSVIHKYAHGLLVSTEDMKKILSSLGFRKVRSSAA